MEHPVDQPIECVLVHHDGPNDITVQRVGRDGVTRIEATTKSGMHAEIPYVRVWAGDVAVAEYCQHQIIGVEFERKIAS